VIEAALDLSTIPLRAAPYLLAAGSAFTAAGAALLIRRGDRHAHPRAARSARASLADRLNQSCPRPPRVPAAAAVPTGTDAADAAAPAGVAATADARERPSPTQASQLAEAVDDRSLARLAERLQGHRNRGLARARMASDLEALNATAWHIERDVITAGITTPFLLLGPTGVFAFSTGCGWSFNDLAFTGRVARDVGTLVVPDYPDPVRSAIYLPFEDTAARSWFDGHGNGGWIVGRGGLPAFLEQFDDRGYSIAEVAVLRGHLAERPKPPRRRLPLPERPLSG
jgi:hypothetical protein